jgi:ketosteroid isomerase-like protein
VRKARRVTIRLIIVGAHAPAIAPAPAGRHDRPVPYHAIVERFVRATWKKMDAGDLDAPWRIAADDLAFTFTGDTPLAGSWTGRDHLRDWLHDFRARYDELHFAVEEVAVSGWPWRTTIATRIRVTGTWLDGGSYENQAVQWTTLRWGKMTRDLVLEDTKVLSDAIAAVPSRGA